MDINDLVNEIIKLNKKYINLEDIEKICKDKYSIRNKNEFITLLTEFKNSKYCLPLIDAPVKFNFISLPSWGSKIKSYIISGLSYRCIEKYK